MKKGSKMSDESREKCRLASLGNRNGLGYKHTEEDKEKIRQATLGNQRRLGLIFTNETISKMREASTGRVLSEESRKKISEFHKGHLQYGYGRTKPMDYMDSTGSIIVVQGPYEYNTARYLDQIGVNWIYVGKGDLAREYSFLLSNKTRYHADFYLPQLDVYLDPKGYWRDQVKYDLVEKEYPEKVKFLVGEDYLEQLKELLQ